MTKDRFNELQQAQKKNGSVSLEMENSAADNKGKAQGGKTKPPSAQDMKKIFDRAEVISQWIESIEENNEQTQILLRRFDDLNHVQKDVQARIDSIFQNNTSIAQQISTKIKEMEGEVNKVNPQSAEGRIKNIQYSTLKTRYQKALLQNNRELENYRSIQKRMLQAQLNAKGRNRVTDEELTALLDEGGDIQIFTENIIAETAEARRILADVEERHQSLIKIERMLGEVRDLFVEMSILIDTQQELIDRVEYQAQTAQEYIGNVDLGSVRRQKKKYIMRKIYCFVVIALVIVIIIILLIKG